MPSNTHPNPRGAGRPANQDALSLGSQSWFFGIGINEYLHFSDLRNAVRDVTALLGLLQDQYEVDHAVTLFDKQATEDNIIKKFDEIAKKIRPEDKLLVVYSGHGWLNEAGQGYWVPHDGEEEFTHNHIANSRIRDYMESIPARHILLVSDSCFSGSLLMQGVMRSGPAAPENILEKTKSRQALCSGRPLEQVYDGEPDSHSPFIQSLLNVLKENQALVLRISTLADVVMNQTFASNPNQTPLYGSLLGDAGGQYIFRLSNTNDAGNEPQQQDLQAIARKLQKFNQELKQLIVENTSDEQDQARRHDKPAHDPLQKDLSFGAHTDNLSLPTFTDPRDGQTYQTVTINGKTWLAQNLSFDAGEGCWFYENDPAYGSTLGRLYAWEAAVRAAPTGWRLPADQEWRELALFAGGYVDYGKGSFWKFILPSVVGDPGLSFRTLFHHGQAGFHARLGGDRTPQGAFQSMGQYGTYWSTTELDASTCHTFGLSGPFKMPEDHSSAPNNALATYLVNRFENKIHLGTNHKSYGFSVRCIRI